MLNENVLFWKNRRGVLRPFTETHPSVVYVKIGLRLAKKQLVVAHAPGLQLHLRGFAPINSSRAPRAVNRTIL